MFLVLRTLLIEDFSDTVVYILSIYFYRICYFLDRHSILGKKVFFSQFAFPDFKKQGKGDKINSADKYIQGYRSYIPRTLFVFIGGGQLAGAKQKRPYCLPEFGIVMKKMADKVGEKPPKSILMQMGFLAALRAVI